MINALKILGYYSLIIALLGLFGNIIIFVVSFKSKTNSMFVLFCYLAISDTLSLLFWNLNHFIYSSFNLDIQNFNVYSCKIGSWIQFSSLQSSAWILVTHFLPTFFSQLYNLNKQFSQAAHING